LNDFAAEFDHGMLEEPGMENAQLENDEQKRDCVEADAGLGWR
jgi:hypothetical protein